MSKVIKQKTPQFGICVDWETSGSDWGGDSSKSYQGISVGVVVFTTADFEPVKTWYREIKFDETRYKWTAEAEAIHGITRERLEANGVTQEEAAIEFVSLLLEYFSPEDSIMFLGHNREFDISFTKQLLEQFGIMFKIHSCCLDTAGIGFATVGLFKSEMLFRELGYEPRNAHNALEDALMTLGCVQRIRLLVNSALGI